MKSLQKLAIFAFIFCFILNSDGAKSATSTDPGNLTITELKNGVDPKNLTSPELKNATSMEPIRFEEYGNGTNPEKSTSSEPKIIVVSENGATVNIDYESFDNSANFTLSRIVTNECLKQVSLKSLN
jgi:hypothetical protein